ncbi:DUF3592 domain-containing protein [Legionella lansingensis]|nr:DUF3592 domain-containing protein [Legionella lansingensis]
MKQLTALFIMASVVTFLLAGYYFIEGWRFSYSSVQTKGEIIGFVVKPSQNNVTRAEMLNYPVIHFETQTKEPFTFTSQWGFNPHKYKVGDKVYILYHPHNPNHVYMGNYLLIWMRFVLVLLAAVFFLLLASVTSKKRQ